MPSNRRNILAELVTANISLIILLDLYGNTGVLNINENEFISDKLYALLKSSEGLDEVKRWRKAFADTIKIFEAISEDDVRHSTFDELREGLFGSDLALKALEDSLAELVAK